MHQRDTFSFTPHIPGGLTTPEQLRQIAAAAEKYGTTLKFTSNGITLMGLALADREAVAAELGSVPESFTAKAVRGITVCTGKPNCPRAQQDSTALGLLLDRKFFGRNTPGKVRIGISACPNCCAEVFVKDIGLFGTAQGFTVVAGGNSGRQARAGRIIASGVPAERIPSVIRLLLDYYRQYAKDKERLGDTLDRAGWDELIAAVTKES
ncbi:Hypothetical protein LUCI_0940 [Lucifera butyrica]|uniref:Nitrite/sulphite reductase 4fe-4s domain n=1 Tax=Lucifera butyrica TaxID=1351585 RepID=A0A498R3G8_9FIRM|nr:nitrite reductase [Lucifera butyrica]VBB05729.1 Hypothetical protein LUCI_0940 [Lucifera butyrica]